MITRYHAYLDESGQREYGAQTDRYFVVTGTIVRTEARDRTEVELEGLKRAFFKTTEVEVKSNWLRNPAERRKHYLDPYGITETRLKNFVLALYRWIRASDILFIAGVVDKQQMEERYKFPHNPSAVGYHIFLQRYQKYLASRHSGGAVTFDEMSGTTKAKRKWRDLLLSQHKSLKHRGCRYTKTQFTNVEDDLTFSDSAAYGLLQVADLAAYNVFRQFRSHGRQWDNPKATTLSLYDYFAAMLPRFHRDASWVFAGYGVAKMPRQAYNQWTVPKEMRE